MLKRIGSIFCGLLAAVLILYFTRSNFELSKKKPFWQDEGNEISLTCSRSLTSMLKDGAADQCSPNPLYYWVERPVVRSLFQGQFDESILWKYRLVSIDSGFLLLTVTPIAAWAAFGPLATLLSIFAISNSALFQIYSAENRPYMLWLLLFAVCFLWVAFVSSRASKRLSVGEYAITAGLLLSLTLVSGAGGIEALALLGGLFLFRRSEWKRIGLVAAMVAAVAWFYGSKACHYTDAGPYDLLHTHDWGLIRPVVELFWLSPFHVVGFLSDALFVVGVFLPFSSRVRRRAEEIYGSAAHLVPSLHLHLMLQFLAGVGVMFLVALKHYYFVPRVFIYLLFLKAVAVALGGVLLLALVRRSRIAIEVLAVVFFAAITAVGFVKRRAAVLATVPPGVTLRGGSLADCAKLTATNWFGYVPESSKPEFEPNSIVAFSRLLAECPDRRVAATGLQRGEVYFDFPDSKMIFKTSGSEAEMAGYRAIKQCGVSYPIRR